MDYTTGKMICFKLAEISTSTPDDLNSILWTHKGQNVTKCNKRIEL